MESVLVPLSTSVCRLTNNTDRCSSKAYSLAFKHKLSVSIWISKTAYYFCLEEVETL